ncbi:MAG: mandelate racemase [Thaumarchaeota archaeon]|nr:mandelate racemase [Nitrososphaerota archaeon]
MKIQSVDAFTVNLPTRRPHRFIGAMGPKSIGNYVIIKIETSNGITGLGEATIMPTWGGDHATYFGETVETTIHIIKDFLSPAILGHDPFNLEHLLEKMDANIIGYPYAKAAVDMALHDIQGKTLDTPAYNLLGGRYRREIPLAHSIGIMPVEDAAKEAKQAVSEGIKTIKLKAGADWERDVETVRTVRETVGNKIKIMVDANQGYPSAKEAIKTIRKMEQHDLLLMEQPVEGLDAMARIAQAVDTPIMADESAWTPQDIFRIVEKKAADVISIYTTKPGGLHRAKKVAAAAEAAGLPCNVNGSIETGVGNAGNLHLAASTSIVKLPCVVPVTTLKGREQTKLAGIYYTDDIVKEPFKYEDGALIVPDKPGLGVELDAEKVKLYKS